MTKPRYPGYDVLAKRNTPSWDEATRKVVDKRLATPDRPRFLTRDEWSVAAAFCERILPQREDAAPVPLAALLDAKLLADHGDGFRDADMPYMREAWRRGLAAIEAEAKTRHGGRSFASLSDEDQDRLIGAMADGGLGGEHWGDLDPQKFFKRRVLVDVPGLFYSHPSAWNEIGFGGPASPRGYVRLDGDHRDAWEAAEATPGHEKKAERDNRHVV
ncbi:gluconate 2-dehydrogenase subunit 3 family protein [Sphingomonas sp. CGMCC 1.13654]|uniref:Gluconate 2-dehydrogenase subunit 3 family protein n=1 Tax=Sphingomonas chungangi TaxID=2683589 RepID=A0A838L7A4_9SPHN|nr:gluconate 2-dehydrogenase subunit 3 family protein [Sphingomonas chungangi]MBA2935201.1 gluconate 2-dehydrogenase subunit 3 family protein [Sphingomonas chungangi]MVW55279.1 gluconate 2-dehydrogenase subunit 3 family protein [Sphingomonas chungangi]